MCRRVVVHAALKKIQAAFKKIQAAFNKIQAIVVTWKDTVAEIYELVLRIMNEYLNVSWNFPPFLNPIRRAIPRLQEYINVCPVNKVNC
jgi:hypothetical protein